MLRAVQQRRADLWGSSTKLALAYLPAPRSCVRTPVPDPWRAFGRNPARSGRYGERDTRQRRSRRVRFCRHPSRPRVEWPDLPGRGNRQRLSVRCAAAGSGTGEEETGLRAPVSRKTSIRAHKGIVVAKKMSRKVSRRMVRPACIAGVRISRPNFRAPCGRTKL